MEKIYKFTIKDIEDIVTRWTYADKEEMTFHWNFEINEPKPINEHTVLVAEQKDAVIPRIIVYGNNNE